MRMLPKLQFFHNTCFGAIRYAIDALQGIAPHENATKATIFLKTCFGAIRYAIDALQGIAPHENATKAAIFHNTSFRRNTLRY